MAGEATAAGSAFGPWGMAAGAAVDMFSADAASSAPPGGIFSSPMYGGPGYAGGGIWNVATSGSRAENSGSALAGLSGLPVDKDLAQYIPYALGFLALVFVWKAYKK